MKNAFWTSLMVIWATVALAHSPLDSTVPANEAIVDSVPGEIVMGFRGNIRLTRVTVTHVNSKADLDLEGFSGFISEYAIPLEPLGPGLYQIEWRGLGDDGHPMNGTFSFTVKE